LSGSTFERRGRGRGRERRRKERKTQRAGGNELEAEIAQSTGVTAERRKKETTATCSRKMSVRANRSVASSILEFRLFQSGFFLVLEGEQAKRGQEGNALRDGPRGSKTGTHTELNERMFITTTWFGSFFVFVCSCLFVWAWGQAALGKQSKAQSLSKGKKDKHKTTTKRVVFYAFAKCSHTLRHMK